ncbi:MAG: diaminopropionate ammonia-lyase [Pseudomonadota bacterium]|nr:diaminopropionate ammonia-lyase [Pseudomonadota bacterium]
MYKDAIETAAKSIFVEKFIKNSAHKKQLFPNSPDSLNTKKMIMAKNVISNWPNHSPTKLRSLTAIAEFCGVKTVYYKDESSRLDLGSFKALGGAYAVERHVKSKKIHGVLPENITVATATDGNHGRSVAWGASRLGCKSKIFIHSNVSRNREYAMAALGADVIRVEGNYESSLAECFRQAVKNGWQIVSDTSWGKYKEIPLQILAGYSLIADEAINQMGSDRPTHTFLPVGCGGLAAAIVAKLWEQMGEGLGKIVSVESALAPCLLQSIEAGERTSFDTKQETVMAGLSCGEVSVIAWDILYETITHCISVNDDAIGPLMKLFANGGANGESIEAGECSTAGLAALLSCYTRPKIAAEMALDSESVVFIIGTEGATDREIYENLIRA